LIVAINNTCSKLDEVPDTGGQEAELSRWKVILQRFVAAAMNKVQVPAAPAPPPSSAAVRQPYQQDHRREQSPGSLDMLQSDLEYFMAKLRPNLMPDVSYGTLLTNTELRELHEVTMPQISKSIDECRRSLKSYVDRRGHDRGLAREALIRCQDATDWVNDLVDRHREKKLHLDKNTKHREITFKVFKSGGEVSIYEFLSRFEAWADDYLSEEAKADQLYHKYLDKSITESYAELTPLRDDFDGMKRWLIRKFGSVVPMAHGVIKLIAKLTVPKKSQLQETVQYLRTVHKLLSNLSELEISKGRPVPRLQEYLSSNAFLTALVNALPNYLTDEFFKELVMEGVETCDTIEGEEHLTRLLCLIKSKYRLIEFKAEKAEASIFDTQDRVCEAVGSVSCPQSVTNPPLALQYINHQSTTPCSQQASQQQNWNRWACPIKDHVGHDVNQCAEFWSMTPQERRESCRNAGCYTCLNRNGDCRRRCSRYDEVPAELVCTDCAQSAGLHKVPACVLFCGLNHAKPAVEEVVKVFESWIPNLNVQALGASVVINMTCLGVHNTTFEPPFAPSKTGPPTAVPSNVVYDTTTGSSRPITRKDVIKRSSEETAFYTMQTVRIRNEEVIIFYDSGSNGHLIEGELAEKLQLDVVAGESVPIGALGGKALWSEYGEYSLTLGPDIHGDCHELALQGIPAITKPFPVVDLRDLWSEANTQLKGCHLLPEKIGGARAKILIGIKATQLVPRLKFLLPSGLGIYESTLLDIYGSNVCFGGPHEIFSQAYQRIGIRSNHVQVMLTELASAYLNSPRSFVRVDVNEHGPPMNLAHELDLEEELKHAFFSEGSEHNKLTSLKTIADEISEEKFSEMQSTMVETEKECSDAKEVKVTEEQFQHSEPAQCLKSANSLSKLTDPSNEVSISEAAEFRCDAEALAAKLKEQLVAMEKLLRDELESKHKQELESIASKHEQEVNAIEQKYLSELAKLGADTVPSVTAYQSAPLDKSEFKPKCFDLSEEVKPASSKNYNHENQHQEPFNRVICILLIQLFTMIVKLPKVCVDVCGKLTSLFSTCYMRITQKILDLRKKMSMKLLVIIMVRRDRGFVYVSVIMLLELPMNQPRGPGPPHSLTNWPSSL